RTGSHAGITPLWRLRWHPSRLLSFKNLHFFLQQIEPLWGHGLYELYRIRSRAVYFAGSIQGLKNAPDGDVEVCLGSRAKKVPDTTFLDRIRARAAFARRICRPRTSRACAG